MVIVSDDFPGLTQAIGNLFPQTDHQLCFLHMQRNIKKNMSKQDAKQFYEELSLIKKINDYEKAIVKFEDLCKSYEKKYPSYIKGLLNKKDNYFNYKKYPEQVRKYIYTTNVVENINSRIELIRANTGGYFKSIKNSGGGDICNSKFFQLARRNIITLKDIHLFLASLCIFHNQGLTFSLYSRRILYDFFLQDVQVHGLQHSL